MSEMDDITKDTGRSLRRIVDAAHSWFRNHRSPQAKAVRLSRSERKELAQYVEAQVGAQRINEAWFTKRVMDYSREHAAMSDLLDLAGPNEPTATRDAYQRLAAMRNSIESTVHDTPLPLDRRGQVVQALNDIENNQYPRAGRVFYKLNPRTSLEVQGIGLRSQQRVTADRDATARAAVLRRAQNAHRTDPQQLAAENDVLRRRIAALESGNPSPAVGSGDPTPFVASVGPSSLIGREHEPGYASVPHQDRPRRGVFASEAQAIAWTRRQLESYRQHSGRRGEEFAVTVWDNRNPVESARAAVGPVGMAADEVRGWDPEQSRAHTQDHAPEPEHVPPEPPAQQQHSAQPSQADRLTQVEQQIKALAEERDRLAFRVDVLHGGMDAVTADRDEHKRQLAATTGEVTTLKNTNTRLAAEIKDLRNKVITTGVERDKYRSERDEAVQQLARNTPAHKRYGSRERVAAEQESGTGTTQPMEPPDRAPRSNGTPQTPRPPIERSR